MIGGARRRPWHWVDDLPRRARIEAGARVAMPTLRYRRKQRPDGPVHVWDAAVDVPGYEPRVVTAEFVCAHGYLPWVYADGPAGPAASPHRYTERGYRRLCIWDPGDSQARRWTSGDGLLALFAMASVHLFKEAWWREHEQWLGEEAPHGELDADADLQNVTARGGR